MAANSPGQQLNDLLVTRNFDPEALDARTGKPPLDDQGAPDPEAADMFTFDWVADSGKNYGTVVCLLGADNNFEVYFGDNLGRGMEFDDKADWYEFLDQLRNFAKRNLLRYDLQNLRRLKYTMAGMAAIKEGLFEGYYGNRKVSYAGEPTQARLRIKHNRTLGENDARFRYVESLFIETVAGEVFKMPFKKLAGGRAMLEHVRHGGTPYDARGQHIVEMVEQINVLSQFRRAHQGRVFEGAAGELIAETTEYLDRLRHNLKAVSNDRGYTQYFESWSPADVSESDLIVEDLKSLFVETRIDPRIEQALPMLARIQKEAQAMREADIFESWANRIVEGTWSLPETPEQQDELKMLMSQPLIAGADGMNATEQLYGLVGDDELFDIIGEIAVDPDANIWDDERVQNRLEELGVYMVTPAEPAQAAETPPVAEGRPEDLPGIDYDRPGDVKRKQPGGDDDHNPYPYSKEEDDDYFREIFRKNKAKEQGVAESDTLAQPAVRIINDFDEVVAEFDHVPKGFRDNLRSSEFDAVQWLADVMKKDPDFDITTIEKIVLRSGVYGPDEHVIDVTEYLDHLDEGKGMAEGTGQFHVYHKVKGDRMGGPDYELLKSFPDKNSAVVFAKSYNEKHGYKRGGFHGAVIRTTTPAQGMAEGLGYSQDPAQAKWYHEGRKAFKGGTTGNLIQDIAKKHGVPAEWIDAFHAGYKDQQGWGKDPVDEGDNLATFEQAGCNQTMEGEYCPEHGLAECGGMYESQLARIKSLAYGR